MATVAETMQLAEAAGQQHLFKEWDVLTSEEKQELAEDVQVVKQ